MKTVRLEAINSGLVDRELPLPRAGHGEVLVRIEAAGVCHSDVHYRDGTAPPPELPITPGHEIAGVIAEAGDGVSENRVGERVCIHYLITCRQCTACTREAEQFCKDAKMIGKYCDGGFAEYIAVPEINAVPIPAGLATEAAAIIMCSTATAYHAIVTSRFIAGETAAVFGVGGLGLSAVQLLREMGALKIFAVDIDAERLAKAESYGAVAINASMLDPVSQIRNATDGAGVDVAIELIGKRITIEQSSQVLAPRGRAAVAGITQEKAHIDTYGDLIGREASVIGVSDHLRSELPYLLSLAATNRIDVQSLVTNRIALDAAEINDALDRLSRFETGVRTVVFPAQL